MARPVVDIISLTRGLAQIITTLPSGITGLLQMIREGRLPRGFGSSMLRMGMVALAIWLVKDFLTAKDPQEAINELTTK